MGFNDRKKSLAAAPATDWREPDWDNITITPQNTLSYSSPSLLPLTIEANGTYTVPEGYDGFSTITVLVREPAPWRLRTEDAESLLRLLKMKATLTKIMNGSEAPNDLTDGAKKLFNYLASDDATVIWRPYLPRVMERMGLTEDELTAACAELHSRGYYFTLLPEDKTARSLFIDHTITETEWNQYYENVRENLRLEKIRNTTKKSLSDYDKWFHSEEWLKD